MTARAVTCNGRPVLALQLVLPGVGAWVAALEVDAEEAITGVVTITDEETTYAGTVVRSGVVSGSCALEVVGGAGGLAKDVPARSYEGVTARTVIGDLLAAVGERLDSSTPAAALGLSLPFWTRAAGRAGSALAAVCDELKLRWRVRQSGGIWVGTETWPEAPETIRPFELDRDDGAGTVLIATDAIGLYPGVTLDGRRVGRVKHSFGRHEPMRTTYWVAT